MDIVDSTTTNSSPVPHPLTGQWSLSITIAILMSWVSTLSLLLVVPIHDIPLIGLIIAIFGRAFLHTGLFILAHDAMHQNLLPRHRQLNHRIGQFCVGLYAFLSYRKCRMNHGKHHQIPAQVGDPDFHDGIHPHPVWWYFKFLRGYLSLTSFSLFTGAWIGIFWVGDTALHIAPLNILLFWLLPLILSSTQLFIFGTYLPHRHGTTALPANPLTQPTQLLWSLLSCYHFGQYHWEHHRYPQTPWYQLPQAGSNPINQPLTT
ncbi:fatty acid desaturase [filamentous cyanobacterium LEGE 11480]|uniref:Fatty acid desaturase n=1 Tax=Romeriopsis navalis LEGE 11480 TaxID=2777977 RepID=A0A928VLY2_9CYAN|nr:fatty acid desaturase [Romeriopsis navalis]MBE9029066.1 fatty acid desaturase [Romeriopsis navalis LEGE 11480]